MGEERTQADTIRIKATVLLFLMVLCVSGLKGVYGFSLFPDEFGYWSAAAAFLKLPWSGTTSSISYYAFGYGLILTPILALFRDSVAAYRAAIWCNLCLHVGAFFLLCSIAKRLCHGASERRRTFFAGIALLYPAWVFYTQTTMAEGPVFFLYILCTYLVLRYLESPRISRLIVLTIALWMLCCVHNRTIGIVLSAAVIVIAHSTLGPHGKRLTTHLLLFLVLSAALIAAWYFLREVQVQTVYADTPQAKIAINSLAGQRGKLRQLLSVKGLGNLVLNLTGKLLYIGCAGFGITYIGFYELLHRSVAGVRRLKTDGRIAATDLTAAFLFLSTLTQLMLQGVAQLHTAGREAHRLDLYLGGRYVDFLIPMLLLTGLYHLAVRENVLRKFLIAAGFMGIQAMIACIVMAVNDNGMDDPHAMLMVGMSWLLEGEGIQSLLFPVRTVLLSILFGAMILATLILLIRKGVRAAIIAPLLLQIVLSVIAHDRLITAGQRYIFGDIKMADHLQGVTAVRDGRIVDLFEGGNLYASILQFRLRTKPLTVLEVKETLPAEDLRTGDYVLVDSGSKLRAELAGQYDTVVTLGHFDLYYNKELTGRN